MITNARSKRRTPRSKTGCIICRKRRVKCDEQRPTCSNCLTSSTPCTYAPPLPSVGSSGADQDHGASVSRRGRGRPRKDWATIASGLRSAVGSGNNGSDEISSLTPPSITALGSSEDNGVLTLNASDLDLLSHFVTHTGPSLGDPKNPNDHISYLWAHNVPQLGQRFPLVLHLAFALTARHMMYLGLNPSTRRSHEEVEGVDDAQELHTLSEFHFTRGLEALRDTLPHVNHDNCGALFVASKLLAFSILAAGPRSPDDLLVCSVGVTAETNPPALRSLWSPLGRDMRFIREAATDDVLFTGLLNSFRPGSDPKLAGPTRDCRPTWLVFRMHRVNWKGPINQLKELVISKEAESREDSNDDQSDKYAAVVGAFKRLERTYEATFGRDEDPTGDIEEPTDKVLIFWLYQLEDGFIESVQRKEPAAMLILAYYSVLFQNLQSRWYLEGWSEHLIRTIATLVAPEYMQMLIWPAKVVGIGNLSSEDR